MFKPLFRELKHVFKLLALAVATLVVSFYVLLWAYLAYARISYELDSERPLNSQQIDVLENRIEKRLEAGDYGMVEHALWVDLFAQSFYAYGRANRYERHPTEESRTALVKVLERTYANIDSVQKSTMRNVWPTHAEGGIIFQWHRLHVLALLAKYRWDEASKKLLFEDIDELAFLLSKAPKHTEESYPGWAWWVDNADAYAAIALADRLSGNPKHAKLIADWIKDIRASRDDTGNVLAEAYGPYVPENQSRSSASAWMLPYFLLLDPAFAKEQISAIDTGFSSSLMGMPVFSEVPVGQEFINSVPTGPVILWASSAWTMLSLAAYNSMWMAEKSKAMERTVRAAFLYDKDEGSVFFDVSTLLDSTLYWALSFRG